VSVGMAVSDGAAVEVWLGTTAAGKEGVMVGVMEKVGWTRIGVGERMVGGRDGVMDKGLGMAVTGSMFMQADTANASIARAASKRLILFLLVPLLSYPILARISHGLLAFIVLLRENYANREDFASVPQDLSCLSTARFILLPEAQNEFCGTTAL